MKMFRNAASHVLLYSIDFLTTTSTKRGGILLLDKFLAICVTTSNGHDSFIIKVLKSSGIFFLKKNSYLFSFVFSKRWVNFLQHYW